MSLRNTATSYGSIAKFLHWLIFLLLFFMIIFGYFLDDIPKDYQAVAYNTHKLTGLTILALMVIRALWALMNSKPVLPAGTHCWERAAERIVHLLLYVTVIGMPLAGWIGSVAGGRPPHIGEFRFDLPIEQNKALSDTAFNVHGILAVCIIVLFVIHVLAALYHHFIKKDDVLRRMLPRCTHV